MVLLETLKMKSINLPDLATFIDVKDEYRNERSFSEQLNLMKASFYNSQNVPSLNEQDKFISHMHSMMQLTYEDNPLIPGEKDASLKWIERVSHFFNFYIKWKRPDYSVKELSTGLYLTNFETSYLYNLFHDNITRLLKQDDWTPPPGTFDRGEQLNDQAKLVVNDLFKDLGIIDIASAYNRRNLSVANVFLHVAKDTDQNWKQFFYDCPTTPKYTNTHIDPKEDVIKAMIYLNDVNEDNGAFKYWEGSNQIELDPLQNIFGRAITTGSYCHNKESRASVFRLPKELRVSHNFGRCVIPGSKFEKELDDNVTTVTKNNIMVFDPGAGIHQGGICKQGTRLALQVLMK